MNVGNQRRAAGIAANLTASQTHRPDYAEAARAALASCIRSGSQFSADDVHKLIPDEVEPDSSHNVVPSLLGVYAAAGLIRRVGAANSARPSRHGSRNALWIAVAAAEEGRPMTRIRARSGDFHPSPGGPGAEVTVSRSDGSEVVGQIQYPHPHGRSWVWVSLWDGRAPVPVQFAKRSRFYGYEGGRP